MKNLTLENNSLKKEVDKLKTTISKFKKGKGTLDNIPFSQMSPSIKHGLGYKRTSTFISIPKTVFVKSSTPQTSSINVNVDALKEGETSNPPPKNDKPLPKVVKTPPKFKAPKAKAHNHSHNPHEPKKSTPKRPKDHTFQKAQKSKRGFYAPRPKYHAHRRSNYQCFYCMQYGHTNHKCYIRKIHLKLIPINYMSINPQ